MFDKGKNKNKYYWCLCVDFFKDIDVIWDMYIRDKKDKNSCCVYF